MAKVFKEVKIHFAMPEGYSESELDIAFADCISDAGGECIEVEAHLEDALYKEEEKVDNM